MTLQISSRIRASLAPCLSLVLPPPAHWDQFYFQSPLITLSGRIRDRNLLLSLIRTNWVINCFLLSPVTSREADLPTVTSCLVSVGAINPPQMLSSLSPASAVRSRRVPYLGSFLLIHSSAADTIGELFYNCWSLATVRRWRSSGA